MARINRHVSSTLSRESSSAFASRTQLSANDPSQASPDSASDKENQPRATAISKAKGRMAPPAQLPTLNSDSVSGKRSAKRARIDHSHSARRTSWGDQDGLDELDGRKYYNPDQDPEERQVLKRKSRALEREFNDNRDVYLHTDDDGLERTINRANSIFERVKQTSDATLDSRLLVSVSDLLSKKSAHMVLGDTSTGLDLDEFVSKCISFMKRDAIGADGEAIPLATQRRRRQSRRDDDDDQEAPGLDWAALGAKAAFPSNLRPPVPGFLLGPLSVQKKARAQTQRRARQGKDNAGSEIRPEALTKDDLGQTENNNLTVICSKIRVTLQKHCQRAESAAEAAGELTDDLMSEYRVCETGGPNLFDFVINPDSFSQTIENIFYVSFLIKEGNVGVEMDSNGLPTLIPAGDGATDGKRSKGSKRHQAVFSIDMITWQKLIKAFDIRTPLIENRGEQTTTQPGERGWYA